MGWGSSPLPHHAPYAPTVVARGKPDEVLRRRMPHTIRSYPWRALLLKGIAQALPKKDHSGTRSLEAMPSLEPPQAQGISSFRAAPGSAETRGHDGYYLLNTAWTGRQSKLKLFCLMDDGAEWWGMGVPLAANFPSSLAPLLNLCPGPTSSIPHHARRTARRFYRWCDRSVLLPLPKRAFYHWHP